MIYFANSATKTVLASLPERSPTVMKMMQMGKEMEDEEEGNEEEEEKYKGDGWWEEEGRRSRVLGA